ncbi:telomerase reverse transcriptase-like [Phymastichus coffea]|uniref:telomerase reverse transcriptase-like n=1 Tax=Phymastichus coffea TaxID=108790 RepID=UPI00273BFE2A|nr:telomerase reverse transcriptase-like [Phymastichus coffea]
MLKKNYFIRYKGSKLHYIIKKKCKYEVHSSQVQEGIRKICYKLLPLEVIGNQKNNKKILKAWKHFVKTSQTEPFNLLNLVNSLNLNSITWIQSIDNTSHKFILIGKFIKWLFQFLIAIVEKVFHVTHIQGEKVFIFIEDWEKQKSDYIKSMCQKPVLQWISPITKYTEVQSRLNFIPKRDNLRPITTHRFTDHEKHILKLLNTLLKYLYQINYQKESKSFNEYFTVTFKNYKCENNDIFIVSCDICDAYGSILQGKLFDMVQIMFQTLATNITFKYEIVRKRKIYQIITEDTNVFSYDPEKYETVNKHVLLQALKKYIFQMKVAYKKNLYNINRGITQGLLISSILCQIYYTHMNLKYFANLEKYGHLFKYVDDYLYITNKLDYAKRFLGIVEKGIPEYNCYFNKSKLEHNLNPHRSQKIRYLGWKFDSKSLEVEPIYKSTRYSIYFNTITITTFPFKLKHLASLKLNKLMLTKHINSSQKIFENVTMISRRQAERCFALLSCLHDTQNQKITLDSIIKVNLYMLRKIELFTNWNNYEKTRNRQTLKYVIWSSFYNVFRKRYDIFSYLTNEFKKLMKMKCKRRKRIVKKFM